jgi:hypothetical protein
LFLCHSVPYPLLALFLCFSPPFPLFLCPSPSVPLILLCSPVPLLFFVLPFSSVPSSTASHCS